MAFTSKRTLTNIRPPKPDGEGVIPVNPYSKYELITNSSLPKYSFLELLLQRWRILTTSTLFDFWENLIVDAFGIVACLLILWWILSFFIGTTSPVPITQ
jgi:hypothetical protein